MMQKPCVKSISLAQKMHPSNCNFPRIMKARPIIILLLFAASILVLAWLYHATSKTDKHAKPSPWRETIADLGECSRSKHLQASQYGHFATVAEQGDDLQAARLFRAMALSDGIQEHNCVKALTRLGGSYIPPGKVVVFRGTTAENIARSIDYERHRLQEKNGIQIDRALAADNRYAAKMLIWASAADLRHIWLMEHCSGHPDRQQDIGYAVCPTCGNIYNSDYCDSFCPLCLTSQTEFVWFK